MVTRASCLVREKIELSMSVKILSWYAKWKNRRIPRALARVRWDPSRNCHRSCPKRVQQQCMKRWSEFMYSLPALPFFSLDQLHCQGGECTWGEWWSCVFWTSQCQATTNRCFPCAWVGWLCHHPGGSSSLYSAFRSCCVRKAALFLMAAEVHAHANAILQKTFVWEGFGGRSSFLDMK